jgi:glycosyltransferase involved in cell wall biosynthesis
LKSEAKKRVIVSVTNDLVCDSRVHKVCTTLLNMGFDIILAGRKLAGSPLLSQREYKTKRFRLPFNKGLLFYACYNIRLFYFLLISDFDLLLANDLDTLPANFIISRIKRKPLVYDSHEYYTEAPELISRPRIKRIWEWMEKKMVPRLDHAYTVCDSIAKIYSQKYNTVFKVVRNASPKRELIQSDNTVSPVDGPMILYQGALNKGRGLRQAVMAMKLVEDAYLVIAGDGNEKNDLESLVQKEGLNGKVKFLGRLPLEELAGLTPHAAIGLSVEEDTGLNYHFALPNKLFDYIQSLVPVVVSDLPEMSSIVRKYGIGIVAPSLHPESLAEIFRQMLYDSKMREIWKQNLKAAANELTWENEEIKVREIFKPFLD